MRNKAGEDNQDEQHEENDLQLASQRQRSSRSSSRSHHGDCDDDYGETRDRCYGG